MILVSRLRQKEKILIVIKISVIYVNKYKNLIFKKYEYKFLNKKKLIWPVYYQPSYFERYLFGNTFLFDLVYI